MSSLKFCLHCCPLWLLFHGSLSLSLCPHLYAPPPVAADPLLLPFPLYPVFAIVTCIAGGFFYQKVTQEALTLTSSQSNNNSPTLALLRQTHWANI